MANRHRDSLVRLLSLAIVSFIGIVPFSALADDPSIDEVLSRYARYGADVWARNPSAKLTGEGQACISCHTSLPYALVEPILPGNYAAYDDLIANISNRVLTWADNTPWYSERKLEGMAKHVGAPPDVLKGTLSGPGSRGVESVFNAVILGMRDAYAGVDAREDTSRAFRNMWAEQLKSGVAVGRWDWIQANLLPWEVTDSDIWGASLACVAAGMYPELSPQADVQLLQDSLKQASASDEVSLHVKSAILWCDAELGGQLLDRYVAANIATDLLELQHEDGGWALRELGPWANWEGSDADCCAQRENRSDAYATGFVTLTLTRSQPLISTEQTEQLNNAVAWIDRQLANPYPAEPRNNRMNSGEGGLPEFRHNLYTNAGHMWAYIARTAHKNQRSPWATN